MDFNKAKTFVEVVDSGGFSAAASRLKRTQQAISLQIQALEKELGISLLVRDGRKIALTQGGEQLYSEFKKQFSAMEDSVQQYKSDKSAASGLIRIGAWADLSNIYFPKLIAQFSEDYPLVEFELHTGLDHELEAMLMDNKIDLSHQVFVTKPKLLRQACTFVSTCTPVVSRKYAQKHELPSTIEETLDMPIIEILGEYSLYRPWFKKNARGMLPALEKKKALVRATSLEATRQMVLEGMGLGFLPLDIIQNDLDTGELIPLSFSKEADTIQVEIDIVYKRENSLGHIHHAFIQFLLDNRGN